MAQAQPPLLARGKLAQTPLPEFLIYAHDNGLDGTLVLQQATGEKSAILFVRGAPAKARLTENLIFLGDVVVDLGLVEKVACKKAQLKAEELGRPHGELLRELGLLDDTGLYLALREQLARQVLQLCRLPIETDFGFYAANYLAKYGAEGEWRVKPLPLLWRALVDHASEERVRDSIMRLGERELRLRVESPVNRYRMTSDETALMSVLRAKPQSAAMLRATGILAPPKVDRVITALLLSRQLDGLATDQEPVGAHEPPESPNSIAPTAVLRKSSLAAARPSQSAAPPSSRAPLAEGTSELAAEIERLIADPPKDHYELLGVPPEADMQTVRAAFFRGARRFHPDKLPPELVSYRDFVTGHFAKMGTAHQVLTDAQKRTEYDRTLAAGKPELELDEEQAQVAAILDAASAYQRSEVLLKKRDFKGALDEARAALAGDPTQPDYVALAAWLDSLHRTSGFEEPLGELDRALSLAPDNVRTLWYRGQLLKKMGKSLMAMKDFKRIIELKPNHVDAQRELRVFQMRKQTDPGAGSSPHSSRGSTQPNARTTTGPRGTTTETKPGGLFGRLLKKD